MAPNAGHATPTLRDSLRNSCASFRKTIVEAFPATICSTGTLFPSGVALTNRWPPARLGWGDSGRRVMSSSLTTIMVNRWQDQNQHKSEYPQPNLRCLLV